MPRCPPRPPPPQPEPPPPSALISATTTTTTIRRRAPPARGHRACSSRSQRCWPRTTPLPREQQQQRRPPAPPAAGWGHGRRSCSRGPGRWWAGSGRGLGGRMRRWCPSSSPVRSWRFGPCSPRSGGRRGGGRCVCVRFGERQGTHTTIRPTSNASFFFFLTNYEQHPPTHTNIGAPTPPPSSPRGLGPPSS